MNSEREFERNRERYEFLKWGQTAFDNFRVVPPATVRHRREIGGVRFKEQSFYRY